jgi:predicted AAA+ superfamily ATPase
MTGELISRRVLDVARQRMAESAVIALQGARSVGKSTVLASIAAERQVGIIDLDNWAQAALVAASPDDFVVGSSPVCIDEYQRVPGLLQAIKGELNRHHAPGRFVLTGSTRFDSLPHATQALTGRIQFLDILPFSQGEIDGVHEDFLDVAIHGPDDFVRQPSSATTRTEYVERVCRGGLPVAIRLGERARRRWFDSYLAQTLSGDLPEIGGIRRLDALGRLFDRLASQTGQLLNVSAAARALELEGRTADNYTQLLSDVFLLRRLPAWGRTLRARVGKTPKLHVVDSGLAAHMLRLTPAKLGQLDPASLTDFGHLLETFVVGELLKQASWHEDVRDVAHWHTHDGQEVDFLIETYDGGVVGFEIKARGNAVAKDLGGLRVLRDLLGNQFRAGFVLNTGQFAGRLEDRIYTCPIDRLWRTNRTSTDSST